MLEVAPLDTKVRFSALLERVVIRFHTNGPDDLQGCALAIAYKNDVRAVQLEDFTIFSV